MYFWLKKANNLLAPLYLHVQASNPKSQEYFALQNPNREETHQGDIYQLKLELLTAVANPPPQKKIVFFLTFTEAQVSPKHCRGTLLSCTCTQMPAHVHTRAHTKPCQVSWPALCTNIVEPQFCWWSQTRWLSDMVSSCWASPQLSLVQYSQ